MTVSISPMTTIKNRCHQIDYRALAETGEISDDLYYFRLCCLLENAAKCANTASVYGAFFKHLKQSAQKTLVIAPADYQINNGEHEVYNEDANSLIKRIEGDILYLDPPYNSRQYSANYHLLNTSAFEKMKDGVMIINTSRGALIDSQAAIEALKTQKIGALGMDVYENERDLFFEDKSNDVIQDDVFRRLSACHNVLFTGHQAFLTAEALISISQTTLDNLRQVDAGEACSNALV